jgi:hypothetical protein
MYLSTSVMTMTNRSYTLLSMLSHPLHDTVRACCRCPSLKRIDVSACPLITDAGISVVADKTGTSAAHSLSPCMYVHVCMYARVWYRMHYIFGGTVLSQIARIATCSESYGLSRLHRSTAMTRLVQVPTWSASMRPLAPSRTRASQGSC